MYEAMIAETIRLRGHDGDLIEAYYARPLGAGPFPSVVLIHHNPGWDESMKEITRKFAYHGFATVAPHLFSREGNFTASAEDASAAARAAGGVSDARMLGDVDAVLGFLRDQPTSNAKVGVIGYCSGGRHCYIVACRLTVDAAVDCYGGHVVPQEGDITPARPIGAIDMTPDLVCPILCFFGVDDPNPSQAEMQLIEAALQANAKQFSMHSYEETGHGFFSVDRPAYRVHAANGAWAKIFDFFGEHLAG